MPKKLEGKFLFYTMPSFDIRIICVCVYTGYYIFIGDSFHSCVHSEIPDNTYGPIR